MEIRRRDKDDGRFTLDIKTPDGGRSFVGCTDVAEVVASLEKDARFAEAEIVEATRRAALARETLEAVVEYAAASA